MPGLVATQIATSGRNRSEEFGGPSDRVLPALHQAVQNGIEPERVGRLILQGVRDRQFYVFTHADTEAKIADRHRRIASAFEWRAAAVLADSDMRAPVAR